MENKEIPRGVKVISVLYFVASLLGVIFGSIYTFTRISINGGFGAFLFISIIVILVSIFSLFASLNLWKGKNWARIFAMIFIFVPSLIPTYVFSFGAGFSGNYVASYLITGLYILINIWMIAYLLFSRKVKEFFGKNQ